MALSFVDLFDSRVAGGLASCGVDLSSPLTLGAAVSGGADSVSLVTALSHVLPPSARLIAVTVNHNLREESETAGDADFVESYCASLGVACVRSDIPRGQILEAARLRGLSLEEAARNARYECFSRFIADNSIDVLALAHNQNDQLETLLMRVLAGGGVESLSGIRERRDRYVRPLLGISRADIERYLSEQGIGYRTDSTNADNALLRNRVRNVLVPSLNGNFPGWGKALLSLSCKMRDDGEFLTQELEAARSRCRFRREGSRIAMDASLFFREMRALRVRLLYAAADGVSESPSRIPYSFFARLADWSFPGSRRESCAGIGVCLEGDTLFVGREEELPFDRGFCILVRSEGCYRAGSLDVVVRREGQPASVVLEACGDSLFLPSLAFPFLIRSRQPGDSVQDAGTSFRSVASVLDGWKCAGRKDDILLIQRLDLPGQPLAAVWGSPFGLKNWVVKY